MIISYIVAPVVGGIIGYITNDLAIRMLFRPHEEKKIFGIRVPFTPGVIPKEKGRIAGAIGTVIKENLLDENTLKEFLLAEKTEKDIVCKLRTATKEFITKQQSNPETVEEFLRQYLSDEEIHGMAGSINESLTRQIHDKLSKQELGNEIANVAVEHVLRKLSNDNQSEDILGILKSLGKDVLGTYLVTFKGKLKELLSRNINDILNNNSNEIVSNLIGDETSRLLSTPVQQLLSGREEQLAKLPDKAVNLYKKTITENLKRILDNVDIAAIVKNRIEGMKMDEAEELILQVMKKELKAIVWLGAGLGFLMGFVNVLI